MSKKRNPSCPSGVANWDCLITLLHQEKPESLGESLRLTDVAQRFYHPPPVGNGKLPKHS
ncbi:MAG: hypothetical protein ACWA5X_09070 [bacterium]